MTTPEIIATGGTILMLVPFILNIADKLHNDSPLYIIPNLVGATAAAIASYLIGFLPFVILEGTWALVSGWALYTYFRRDFPRRKKHYVITSKYGHEIGCCYDGGKKDVELEEPGSTFREVKKENCPVCN